MRNFLKISFEEIIKDILYIYVRGLAITLWLISCTSQSDFIDCDEKILRYSLVRKISSLMKSKPNDLSTRHMIIHYQYHESLPVPSGISPCPLLLFPKNNVKTMYKWPHHSDWELRDDSQSNPNNLALFLGLWFCQSVWILCFIKKTYYI